MFFEMNFYGVIVTGVNGKCNMYRSGCPMEGYRITVDIRLFMERMIGVKQQQHTITTFEKEMPAVFFHNNVEAEHLAVKFPGFSKVCCI